MTSRRSCSTPVGEIAVEKKASAGLKIDPKIIKISLGSGEVAAKRKTPYSIEFNFGAPRRDKCGFLRPATRAT